MLKLRTSYATEINKVVSAEENLVTAAEECCTVAHDMISAGVESREIEDVIRNVMFIRDEIKLHGIKSYYYNIDKNNEFAAKYNLPPYTPGMGLEYCASLRTQYVEAAEEGLKVWWQRFYEALKNLISKFVAWCSTTFTFRNRYLEKIKKDKDKLDKLDEAKEVECMNCDDFENLYDIVETIHKEIKNAKSFAEAAKNLETRDSLAAVAKQTNPHDAVERFKKVGYTLEQDADDGSITLSEDAEGLSEKCPVKKETLKTKRWTAIAAKRAAEDLLRLESKDDFKKMTTFVRDTMAKIIDDGLEELAKKTKESSAENKEDTLNEISVKAIHARGSYIRYMNKLMILENRFVVRMARTIIAMIESCPEKEDK